MTNMNDTLVGLRANHMAKMCNLQLQLSFSIFQTIDTLVNYNYKNFFEFTPG